MRSLIGRLAAAFMAGARTARRDPAPSRWAWRAERLWLTPGVRRGVTFGLPLVLGVAVLGAWLAKPATRAELAAAKAVVVRSIADRPEFRVALMAIDGASPALDADIREVLALDFPLSSFDLDLPGLRAVVLGLDAVEAAEMRIRPGGILAVSVTERRPAVIWRSDEGLELLDAGGHRVAPLAARAERPDLVVVAGEGAELAVGEALALVEAAGPVAGRVRGLVRMGERRWDLVLDRGQRILLPEAGAVAALERVVALDQAEDMLARDIALVDMRNPARPTVRLASRAEGAAGAVTGAVTGAGQTFSTGAGSG